MNYNVDNFTLARPYAKAAFSYAREHEQLSQWAAMSDLAAQISVDDAMAELLSTPAMDSEQLKALFVQVGGEHFDAAFIRFMTVLAENKRLQVLPEVHYLYAESMADHEQTITATVISSHVLNKTQCKKIASALSKRLQREVSLQCEVDASLIGGVVIKAGDLVIDSSVRRQLQQMKRKMMA